MKSSGVKSTVFFVRFKSFFFVAKGTFIQGKVIEHITNCLLVDREHQLT